MRKFFLVLMVCSMIFLSSCNQTTKPDIASTVQSHPVSEFKDSTSFTKGTKVFIVPLTQMRIIDSVTLKQGKHYYYVNGKIYVARDIKSLD